MSCRVRCAWALVLLGLAGFAAAPVLAQTADTAGTVPAGPSLAAPPAVRAEPPVMQYYLDGPRIGVTFLPDGTGRSQFGWHGENQAAPGSRGPWFLVERILLIGGVERGEFIPTGSVIFGVRTPSSFEFGVGPSVSIGPRGFSTAVVIAAGQTLHYGGVRVPLNLAIAMSQKGGTTSARVTLISGWAIKQSQSDRPHAQRPYRFGLEK